MQARAPRIESDDSDDDLLDDDISNEIMERLRAQKMGEMRAKSDRARFGEVLPIIKADYKREVTDASRGDGRDTEGKGIGVVCFLYKDSEIESRLLGIHIKTLAKRYPATKFTSIISDMCIEGYPCVTPADLPLTHAAIAMCRPCCSTATVSSFIRSSRTESPSVSIRRSHSSVRFPALRKFDARRGRDAADRLWHRQKRRPHRR